jgi:glutamine synthetase
MTALPLVEARIQTILKAHSRNPRHFSRTIDGREYRRSSEFFGVHTFSFHRMQEKLANPVFHRFLTSIRSGGRIDPSLADAVAHAVKEWATSHGATHFCHWFQPMTGLTAEKHEAFLDFDKQGVVIERLSGKMLTQSEPDASSFPSGGSRSTFEARGYTAWDPSSPMFLMENPNGRTLCIPSVFVSFTGEALDTRTRLLRSMVTLDREALRLLLLLGEDAQRVVPTVGCEQEFFLVDRALVALRPDLLVAGRTIVGARPPKGQSMEDHYFGSIPSRVLSYLEEVEFELAKLGVPVKTRHNEVAPSQFELAPLFAEANVAVDHNQLIMEVLRRVAPLHDFTVLLHEKPFAWVNGSGKHVNWSLQTDRGENLLDQGTTPGHRLRFFAFLAAVVLGVHRNAGVLRASIATHGNDFRLGGNEAPPSILSVFLGDQLDVICDAICEGKDLPTADGGSYVEFGLTGLPQVAMDATDRNRTSPLAFTGNKFEFRAPGSSQNPADPITMLNTAVADGMRWISDTIAGSQTGTERSRAVMSAIRAALVESRSIRFEGNGYCAEWQEEARRRGLGIHRSAPEALGELKTNAASLIDFKTFTKAELDAYYLVNMERYVTSTDIEVDLLKTLVDSLILPAVLEEKAWLGSMLSSLSNVGSPGERSRSPEGARFEEISLLLVKLCEARGELEKATSQCHGHEEKALTYARTIAPAMMAVRTVADKLEEIVSDGRWPLPKVREMLYL